MPEITVTGLSVVRARTRVLRDVNFVLERGVTVVLGPNGAGKTSLFRVLVGLDRAAAGTIARSESGGRLGFVPQDVELPPGVALADAVLYAAWLQRVPRAERGRAVAAALEATRLQARSRERCDRLSGGMRRRAALACALVHEPDVLVLDEPAVGLDPAEQEAFRELVREQGARAAVVMSTHVLEEAAAVADRLIVLAGGIVAYSGNVEGLGADADQVGVDRLRAGYLRLVGAAD